MSNTIINWRFWAWHLQVLRWGDWRWNVRHNGWPIRICRNAYWAKGGIGRSTDDWTPIALYEGRRYLGFMLIALGLLVWAL